MRLNAMVDHTRLLYSENHIQRNKNNPNNSIEMEQLFSTVSALTRPQLNRLQIENINHILQVNEVFDQE